MTKCDYSRNARVDQHKKINVICHINKEKTYDHLNQCRKGTDKIQYLFMIKAFNKLAIQGNFLNMIKDIYEKRTVNVILRKTENFPSKMRIKTKWAIS